MEWRFIGLGVMFVLILSSAIGVVLTKHYSRKFFIELQSLEAERDELEIEWGRLQLEQSTWATHGRIEKLAREHLQMQLPKPGAAVIVHK